MGSARCTLSGGFAVRQYFLHPSGYGMEHANAFGMWNTNREHLDWLGQITASATQHMSTSGINSFCPGTGGYASNYASGVTPWPATAPALTNSSIPTASLGNGCYGIYAQVNYVSSNVFDVVTNGPGQCDTSIVTCPVMIPPVQGNTSLDVLVASSGSGNVVSSVVDTTNGTTTDTLIKRGTCIGVSGGQQICIYSTDRATAGVNGVTCTFNTNPSSIKVGCYALEVAGTKSTSFDQYEYDSAYTFAPSFTSGNTPTTTAAPEFLVGFVFGGNGGSNYGTGTWTPGGSWKVLYYGGTPDAPRFDRWSIQLELIT